MHAQRLKLGTGYLNTPEGGVTGGFVTIDGERFYRIANVDLMPDFFMTIVSDANHWMFLSSNGALSAGRQDRENAIFPYYTVDKIHDFHGVTGSRTVLRCQTGEDTYLWEPFSKPLRAAYRLERALSKSIYGNKIIFEETNHDLGLRFEYGWYNSDRYGWVKQSRLVSLTDQPLDVTVLDGLGNILPSEVEYAFQNEYSNLLDGYKKSELMADSQLGLFFLSAIPIDRAEPSESLRATTVWSRGVNTDAILLSDQQFESFRLGGAPTTEWDVKGRRSGYYITSHQRLSAGETAEWMMVTDLNQTSAQVANLQQWLCSDADVVSAVRSDVSLGTERLKAIVASADGIQASREELTAARHFSNTLFNVMRGGVYLDNYQIDRRDFAGFVGQTNATVANRFASLIEGLGSQIDVDTLREACAASGDADLIRIGAEYLPLTFSRRHGDPSRPWNQFSIITKHADGSPISDYQGNWRDIFQNWEALSVSFPGFIGNIISKFLNATTADGYNPYRITKQGIDWERPDPEDPWAYIGYWGDHQIIYLQKLFEVAEQYYPGSLDRSLGEDVFAYANVPYRIKPYSDILIDPQNTIDFDVDKEASITALAERIGADGRLLQARAGGVYHVNMTEKVLVTLLAKLSNLVPEAGIWMNTQRPEWNDANNALVGNGASMVTTCYLRRFLAFWGDKFAAQGEGSFAISEEVLELLHSINEALCEHEVLLTGRFNDAQRRSITDRLGMAGSLYRERLYRGGFSGKRVPTSGHELAEFCRLAQRFTEHSIRVNEREDGLYHAYNLIGVGHDTLSIRHLYEMLEGQVAVLSAGCLTPEQSLKVLDTMKSSRLYRENQYTYMLYPDRELTRFTEKNRIPAPAVAASPLLSRLLAQGDDSIIEQDDAGNSYFSSEFHNASYLSAALDALSQTEYGALIDAERDQLLSVYESIFDHQSFTGRSGTFYAYEGLGCVYWHMVSKLLLAVSETIIAALAQGADAGTLNRLKEHYFEIKAGIGLFKSPDLYGAFPTDAYSHTSRDAGVKQPGMTGQVKEDVLSRLAEVGVRVHKGSLGFDTRMLNPAEFLVEPAEFEFIDITGEKQRLALDAQQLAFSFCQVPVVYTVSDRRQVVVTTAGGEQTTLEGDRLDAAHSQQLFARTGDIQRIDVSVVM